MTGITCGNWIYYSGGECRFYPPEPGIDSRPKVEANSFCGKFTSHIGALPLSDRGAQRADRGAPVVKPPGAPSADRPKPEIVDSPAP